MKRNVGDFVSGKLGNVVFVHSKGNSYVINSLFCKKNNWSEAQLMYRARFKTIVGLWRAIKSEPMKKIWNLAIEEMNGYAWLIKKNITALSIAGTSIDPKLLMVTDGKLNSLQKVVAERLT